MGGGKLRAERSEGSVGDGERGGGGRFARRGKMRAGSREWRAEGSEGGEEWKWSGGGMEEFFF
jgi:hypothetical protein